MGIKIGADTLAALRELARRRGAFVADVAAATGRRSREASRGLEIMKACSLASRDASGLWWITDEGRAALEAATAKVQEGASE